MNELNMSKDKTNEMRNTIVVIAIALLTANALEAQNPQWIHYRTNNSGLPSNFIQCLAIEVDSSNRNVVWIGDGIRLTKFDGTNWTVYDSSITGLNFFSALSIRFDSKKNIWMGTTDAGLIKFDRNSWTVFNTSNSKIPSHYVPYIDINPDDLILIGSPLWGNQAYCEFDGVDQWTIFDTNQIPANLRVQRILHEPGTNNRWIGCYRSLGAVLYNGNEFIIYSTTNSGISANSIFGLAIDEHHNKFFGPEFISGISKFDSTNTQWSVYGPSLYGAHDMAFDQEGNLWWIVEGVQALGGLFKATKDFDTVKVWNATNSPMITTEPRTIAIDSNGNKWIGTGGGLFVFNEDSIVNIDDNKTTLPEKINLFQNYPNPFNPVTTIKYDLNTSGVVKLNVYDLKGKLIKILVDNWQAIGSYDVEFDGSNLSSGVYFYELKLEGSIEQNFRETRRMILIK
ncbi:MAG: T9SS type A sorting domain-containing protein [Ignavibacteria bacterium]|nr:T9SS type A sorting domain-containing protein [Ignavibacteria bacterium]